MKPYVACAVCSVRRAHGAGYGRAEHMCSRGEPLGVRGLLCNAQSDVMAAHVVGIQQEGESLPDGAVQERRGTRAAAMTSRATCKVRELRVAALVLRKLKKKKRKTMENERKPRFRVNRIPGAGVKDPLSWAQDITS